MSTFNKRILTATTIALLLILASGVYLLTTFNSPPFPLERLDRLTPGMSKTEVKCILGEPDSVFDQGRAWAYSRFVSWPIVYVYFDRDGTFKNAEYDF